MSERHKINVEYQASPERSHVNVEHQLKSAEVSEDGPEFIETARRAVDRAQETAPHHSPERSASHPGADRTRITTKDKARAYQQTLSVIQRGLPPLSRSFSKIIHQPAVERLSELAETTVARPSALLGGGVVAALGLGVMLYFARRNGFALSGSELALFLVSGWLLGLAFEMISRRLRRR